MRRLTLVALALLVWAQSAGAAPAGAVPDSATRAALQKRIGRLAKVRLLGPAGQETILLKPLVRDDGLHMREPYRRPRPAVIVLGEVPAPPPPVDFVPWSAIDEVQVARGDPARGALSGALFGVGVVAISLAASHRVIQRYPEDAMPLVFMGGGILVAGCTVVGAVVGSYTEGWRTVHPEPPPPAKRRP